MEGLSSSSLWDDYRIIDNIMVSSPLYNDVLKAIHVEVIYKFKDHLVTWVEEYIKLSNTPSQAKKILADIDRR